MKFLSFLIIFVIASWLSTIGAWWHFEIAFVIPILATVLTVITAFVELLES